MERLIVFALVFLLPTQLAYHFWPQFSYVHGLRVDYLAPAIYLTDIFIVLLFPYLKKWFYLLPLVFLALINTVFAQVPLPAFLKWLVVFKMAILGLYFYSCDRHKLKGTIVSALSLSLIFFFIIGFGQFILQRTIGGPLYLLGERSFTASTPGISLVNFFGKNIMRAYSTFSHPNSFAGFVVVSFLVLLSFYSNHSKIFLKGLVVLFAVALLSLFLTFSLNAIVGVCFVVTLFFALRYFPKIIKKIKVFFPIVAIGLSLLFGIVSGVLPKEVSLSKTYKERVVLAGYAIQAFSQEPVLGVGLNNFFIATKSIQPPHNIYLIVLSETGIVGMVMLFFWWSKLFSRRLNKYLFLAIFFVLTTGLFDHYWFTLQQNQLLLSLLLGLSVRKYNT